MGITTYSCTLTSTCPTSTTVSVTDTAYSCCSTANCNTGTVALTASGISCNVGTTGSTVTATGGCYTSLCQVGNKDLKGQRLRHDNYIGTNGRKE